MNTADEFDELVHILLARFDGIAQRAATRLGMTLSAFLRAIREQRTFSVENCLRVAVELGVPADRVLRAARKTDVADLLAQLYGAPARSEEEQRLARMWKRMPPKTQRALEVLMGDVGDTAQRRIRRSLRSA